MDELLRKRIDRALESLSQEQAYQALDYLEFLQSKYADRRGPSAIEKIANGVEDTLRVSKVPIAAIKGTREVFNTAERVMRGLADASRTVVDGLQEQVNELTSSAAGDAASDAESDAVSDRPEEVEDAPASAPDTGEENGDRPAPNA